METSGLGREIPIGGRNVNPMGIPTDMYGAYGGFNPNVNVNPFMNVQNPYVGGYGGFPQFGTDIGFGVRDITGFGQNLPFGQQGLGGIGGMPQRRSFDLPFGPITPQTGFPQIPTGLGATTGAFGGLGGVGGYGGFGVPNIGGGVGGFGGFPTTGFPSPMNIPSIGGFGGVGGFGVPSIGGLGGFGVPSIGGGFGGFGVPSFGGLGGFGGLEGLGGFGGFGGLGGFGGFGVPSIGGFGAPGFGGFGVPVTPLAPQPTPLLGRDIDSMLWRRGNIANKLWIPRTNILDEGETLRVEVELPGVKPEETRVFVRDNVLVISPAKPIPQVPKEKGLPLQHEGHFGYFYRQLLLPDTVDPKKVTAEHEDGIVRITIPKSSEATGQRVNISRK